MWKNTKTLMLHILREQLVNRRCMPVRCVFSTVFLRSSHKLYPQMHRRSYLFTNEDIFVFAAASQCSFSSPMQSAVIPPLLREAGEKTFWTPKPNTLAWRTNSAKYLELSSKETQRPWCTSGEYGKRKHFSALGNLTIRYDFDPGPRPPFIGGPAVPHS